MTLVTFFSWTNCF